MKIGRATSKKLQVLLGCLLLVPGLANAQRIEYYHLDALGSVRAVTDENADVIERHDYLPYGEEWNPEPSTNSRKFTGKERDEETGFDYFGARYYEAQLARFTTIDPALTFEENRVDPQRWNRYAYVRNNPMRYVDPDGKILETPWDIFNITLGLASLGANVAVGNVGGAAADAVGLAIDVAAAVVPGVPGGAGTAIRAIRGADKVADITRTTRRGRQVRSQIHHVATDKSIKSGFTEQFNRVFSRAGMNLQDDANKLLLQGHSGRHSPKYHQYVLGRLKTVTDGLSGNNYTRALRNELGSIRTELTRNPDLVKGIGLE